MAEMNAAERFALIKENLQEILNPDIIEGILAEGRNPKIYWGTTQPFSWDSWAIADVFFSN
jgi:tyrosyl-tRNA synthetase